MRTIRLFVSSPGDVAHERQRVQRVVARLNGEFAQTARIDTFRWETKFYQAHRSFQAQIPEAASCDLVIAVFWSRLGSELPPDFPAMHDGRPYPSGSAYEVLSAIEARTSGAFPDVYVFKKTAEPLVPLNDRQKLALAQQQWERLEAFFETWFKSREGHFLAAFHTFRTPDEFEDRLEALLHDWLSSHVTQSAGRVSWPIETKGSPFRGLDAFDAARAGVFFGRRREIAIAAERLAVAMQAGSAYLLVIGASGVGKSSFVQAGLVPRLTTPGVVREIDEWRVATMRPGTDPIAAFSAALYENAGDRGGEGGLAELSNGDYPTPTKLAELIRRNAAGIADPVVRALDRASASAREREGFDRELRAALILVVDQLDELFGEGVSVADRSRFSEMLSALVGTGRAWVVATLRGDLYEHYLAEPALLALKQKGAHYDLVPPGPAELAEILRKPAEAAGLIYEALPSGERLDERLLHDAGTSDILPMLQFTLQRLFDLRESAGGEIRLTHAAYESFGGLGGAIDRAAEAALDKLDRAEVEVLPWLFRRLVGLIRTEDSVHAERQRFALRSMPVAEIARNGPGAKLVAALVDARILTAGGQVASVRLAHERVLESWRRARSLIQANENYYRITGETRDQLRRWVESGAEAASLLPRGSLLSNAEAIVADLDSPFDQATREFISASRWRSRIPRLNTAMLSLFPVIVVAAVVIPNMASMAFRAVFIVLFLALLAVIGTWPICWAILSWRYRRYCLNTLDLLLEVRRSTMADGESGAGTLTQLRSAVLWDMRAAWLNAAMVTVLALAEVALLGADTYLGELIGLSRAMQSAMEGYQVFAAAMVLVVWPLAGIVVRWRRRGHARTFLQDWRTQRSLELSPADRGG